MTLSVQNIIKDLEYFENALHKHDKTMQQLRTCWRSLWEMHTRLMENDGYSDSEAIVIQDALIGTAKGLAIEFCKLREYKECTNCLDCKGQGHLFEE